MTTNTLATAFTDSDREFWHGVLTGGGFTPIPRWTLDPVPGVAVCEAAVPRDLLPALRQRAAELGVPLSSVLLAAHATVMAALSGEPEVVTGYLAGIRGVPLPCRLAAAPGSWRTVLLEAHRTEWELLAHQDFPVGDLAGELGLTGPAFKTVFDALGGEGTLAPGIVLWVAIWPQRDRLALRPDGRPQHGARRQHALAAQRVEHGLEGRTGQAELARQVADREVLVSQQLPLGPVRPEQGRPPRTRPGRQPARQRHPADPGQVAGHHLGLTRNSRHHRAVRSQQHRAERHPDLRRPLPQRRQQITRNRRLTGSHPGHRIQRPPRDRSEPAPRQHTMPELAVRISESLSQTVSRHVTSPSRGFPPTARAAGFPRPS